ncbi:MAG: MerR family transcriptional regulator [Bdellovibrionales bacterium]|nr:MerR family transcriptional regulator [Bdellovibrionales bacterium]
MKIGALASRTGLTVDAIRFYEKQGLIKSLGRTEGGYREFSSETTELLKFIAKCRALDISIPEIRKLLQVRSRSSKSCREANLVIDDQLAKLRARIKELKKLESQLSELRSVCNQELDPEKCEIIKALNR